VRRPRHRMTECSIDLRVGGNYHSSSVTGGRNPVLVEWDVPGGGAAPSERWGRGASTAGRVSRRSKRWKLQERDAVTAFTWRVAFCDKAGRDHMTGFDGQQNSTREMENTLMSLLTSRA
jgi:hypothetical protein